MKYLVKCEWSQVWEAAFFPAAIKVFPPLAQIQLSVSENLITAVHQFCICDQIKELL